MGLGENCHVEAVIIRIGFRVDNKGMIVLHAPAPIFVIQSWGCRTFAVCGWLSLS